MRSGYKGRVKRADPLPTAAGLAERCQVKRTPVAVAARLQRGGAQYRGGSAVFGDGLPETVLRPHGRSYSRPGGRHI